MDVASLVAGLVTQVAGHRYKFRKAKSCFNDFWVGVVKNGHEVYETLKSVLS